MRLPNQNKGKLNRLIVEECRFQNGKHKIKSSRINLKIKSLIKFEIRVLYGEK